METSHTYPHINTHQDVWSPIHSNLLFSCCFQSIQLIKHIICNIFLLLHYSLYLFFCFSVHVHEEWIDPSQVVHTVLIPFPLCAHCNYTSVRFASKVNVFCIKQGFPAGLLSLFWMAIVTTWLKKGQRGWTAHIIFKGLILTQIHHKLSIKPNCKQWTYSMGGVWDAVWCSKNRTASVIKLRCQGRERESDVFQLLQPGSEPEQVTSMRLRPLETTGRAVTSWSDHMSRWTVWFYSQISLDARISILD